MSTNAEAATASHCIVKLPPLGTLLPQLGGTFRALQAAKPGSGMADYSIIVPKGSEFEVRDLAWGSQGKDEPGAACMWDGLANSEALLASGNDHPIATALRKAREATGLADLYIPSPREMHALFAAGAEEFDRDRAYWTSAQYSRLSAFGQNFDLGNADIDGKSWQGGCARFVRRSSIESLID